MLRVTNTCYSFLAISLMYCYCNPILADSQQNNTPDEQKSGEPVRVKVADKARKPVSGKWTVTNENNTVIQQVFCKEDNDYCPELRISSQATDKNHNPAFLDRIIAQHIDQLRIQDHESIDYDIEQLGKTSSVRITSLRKTIKHNTLIAIDNKHINTYHFKAHLKYYFFHEKDIQSFVEQLAYDKE